VTILLSPEHWCFASLGQDHTSGIEASITHSDNLYCCLFFHFATTRWILLKSSATLTLFNNPSNWCQIVARSLSYDNVFMLFFPSV